jgi:pimeloyl-ACP methyl ester carboxylesterase
VGVCFAVPCLNERILLSDSSSLSIAMGYSCKSIGGHDTEILKIPSEGSRVMLFIPGNPGIARYYERFLERICSMLDDAPTVYCCSYPGHTPATPKLEKPLSLEQQVHHKLAVFDYIRQLHPYKQLILAGHSLGAFMAVEILKRRSPDMIAKVIVLFPTLHSIGTTPNGKFMKRLSHPTSRFLVGGIASTLNAVVPRTLIEWIVARATRHSGDMLVATTDLIVHLTGRHALALAHDEMHLIGEMDQHTVDTLRTHSGKIAMYYGTIDGWCPLWHYHEMKARVPECTQFN